MINDLAKKIMEEALDSGWEPPETTDVISIVELDGIEDLVDDNGILYAFFTPAASLFLRRVKQFTPNEGGEGDCTLNGKEYEFLGRLNAWEGEVLCYGTSFRTLAGAMTEPIRRGIDYQSIGRKIMPVEPLPDGALSYYNNNEKQ